MSTGGDLPREEYFSEALEIVETLGRDLLALDEGLRGGSRPDPEVVNDLFRAVHTLKGIAGLFGPSPTTELSHGLEDLLDRVRLGRTVLDEARLDLLFQAIDLYGRILAAERVDAPPPVGELDELLRHLEASAAPPEEPKGSYELDPGLLAVLTEYEEHRLRTAIAEDKALFRLRVRLDLAGIDTALEALKTQAKSHAEIITYLPTGAGSDADTIELDVLLASGETLSNLGQVFGALGGDLQPLARRTGGGLTVAPGPQPDGGRAAVPGEASAAASLAPGAVSPRGGSDGRGALARAGHGARSAPKTVRVDIRKLDGLMNTVGELGLVRSALARLSTRLRAESAGRAVSADLVRLERSFERHLTAIREGVLDVRMVPLGQAFEKLARAVRQLGRDAGKQVNLVVTGGETEVDKLIVESLSDPLVHVIRNSIDHGIEPRSERESLGKPAIGTIAVNAFQKGNHVVVEIEDDGRGIDVERLLAAVVARELIRPEEVAAMSRRDLLGLVFVPGATTRSEVSELSGRGVGMDVVKTNIAKLGGIIDLASEPGIGTKITITLPATLAIVKALLVRVRLELFALPLANVEEALVLDADAARRIDGRHVVGVRGQSIALCRISKLLALEEPASDAPPSSAKTSHEEAPESPPSAPEGGAEVTTRLGSSRRERFYVVIVSIGAQRLGLMVDGIVGEQDVVIKPLGPSLANVRGFAGATELDDRRVALVLDTPGLVSEFFADATAGQAPNEAAHD